MLFSNSSGSRCSFPRIMGAAQSIKKRRVAEPSSPSSSSSPFHNPRRRTELIDSYESACGSDSDLEDFDSALRSRTNKVLHSLAGGGVGVRAMSFDSLKDVTECLLDMDQQVVRVILECKKDIWRNRALFELVEEYFDNSLKTLDFCAELEKCLKRARDGQLLVQLGIGSDRPHDETLEELKRFREAGDPFTEEFFHIFHSVYGHQVAMLEKLRSRKKNLDRRLKRIRSWRKISGIIFAAAFASVLICSVVAAAVAAPPVAGALAAAASIPLGSMGKWVDSLLGNLESAVRWQKETVNGMQAGTFVSIKDLDTIRVLIDRVEVEMKTEAERVDFAINGGGGGGGVKVAIEEIRKKVDVLGKKIEELGKQADVCSRDIRRARTVILQRIIKTQ